MNEMMEDDEMRGRLREHFTREMEEIAATRMPPSALCDPRSRAGSGHEPIVGRSLEMLWVAAAAVILAAGAMVIWRTHRESPRVVTVQAIEKRLASGDPVRVHVGAPLMTVRGQTALTPQTIVLQTGEGERYRAWQADEHSLATYGDIPAFTGFDGESSWYFDGSTVRVAKGDVNSVFDCLALGRFVTNTLLRDIVVAPEKFEFRRRDSASKSTQEFEVSPVDLTLARSIDWTECVLVVDNETEAILRCRVLLIIGGITLPVAFEVVPGSLGETRIAGSGARSFTAVVNVPKATPVVPVSGFEFNRQREAALPTMSGLDNETLMELRQLGYIASRR